MYGLKFSVIAFCWLDSIVRTASCARAAARSAGGECCEHHRSAATVPQARRSRTRRSRAVALLVHRFMSCCTFSLRTKTCRSSGACTRIESDHVRHGVLASAGRTVPKRGQGLMASSPSGRWRADPGPPGRVPAGGLALRVDPQSGGACRDSARRRRGSAALKRQPAVIDRAVSRLSRAAREGRSSSRRRARRGRAPRRRAAACTGGRPLGHVLGGPALDDARPAYMTRISSAK